jgi:hypothetical protein
MASLRELQRRMMRAVLDDDPDGAAGLIAAQSVAARSNTAQDIAPAQRLTVYSTTARANFIDSLASSYPAVRRLVGTDYFARCARGFHHLHPSASGDLQPAGAGFAQYLRELHGADQYRYLGEVARLEWLIQEALLGPDHSPFDLSTLELVAPEAYDDLRFRLHPTARLFASEFPCVHIWQANVGSDAEPEIIDLSAGGDRVLLLRSHAGELTFHHLSRGEQAFLHALATGERFAGAVDAGVAADTGRAPVGAMADAGATAGDGEREFDAAAALQRFVLAGVIVAIQ